MKLLKFLAVAALTIPAVSYAACPKSVSGTYGGFIFNDSFTGSNIYNDRDASIVSITFTSASSGNTIRVNEIYNKSSMTNQGQTQSPSTGAFLFNNRTCFGSFNSSDGGSKETSWRFVVLESGAVIKGILYSQTGTENSSERDVRTFILRKI
jgi:hypothetical protein